MSEPLSNDVSTESLCTVIETSSNEYLSNKFNKDPIKCVSLESLDTNRISPTSNNLKTNGCLRNSLDESCDTDTTEKSINNATTEEEGDGGLEKKPKTKLKKSVSFDPNDEKIKKFIAGEPIVDQQNPFKSNGYLSTTNGGSSKRKDKKTPPPVPAKRSTLSVRKTVTQQLREREREKEKERERQKNETNNRKSNGIIKSPSDEFVTTEEVLKQSKYVKTYIKNPDPYFVYDPTVLARLKFEELRDLALKKPPKRIVTQNTPQPQPRERLKELKNRQNESKPSKPPITFKKCSKPNYPELSDLKIKTGTVLEDSLYNPLEVTKNAKKFDERVKKLHISSDDDLDEIEEPLTKSESSDDNNMSGTQQEETGKMPQSGNNNGAADPCVSSREPSPSPPPTGTFTNTIKSKEFQEYLEKKGLTLIPKKIPNGAQPMYGKKSPTSGGTIKQISFKAEPERIQFSSSGGGSDSVDAAGRNKPSVFQRLLANSIFASRRKTTPKEPVPIIKPSYDGNQENGSLKPIKRVVLERQSFHGRPKAGNLLSPAEALELKQQLERSRKSYASGDDISLSISSALANAEHQNGNENLTNSIKSNTIGTPGLRRKELQGKSITKPPRRTLSRERITKYEPPKMMLSERPTNVNNNLYTLAREPASAATAREKNDTSFRRTIDRQSMIPKRTTQPQDRQQIFGRSSSMDRNEILKRNANHGAQSQQPANQQQRSNSVTGETLLAPITTRSGDNVQETTFPVNDGPPITSTPKRGGESGGGNPSTSINTKNISPISSIPKKASQLGVYVDQQEWERLRAIKEQTDRELYYRVMQQQQKLQQQQQQDQQQDNAKFKDQQNIVMSSPSHNPTKSSQNLENIYEHLPGGSQVRLAAGQDGQFTRGSPQRNTFSGVIRSNANRQVKIIDGKPVVAPEARLNNKSGQNSMPRCQSVLGNVTARGYESETPETPVVLRRKAEGNQQTTTTRRIGGLLTREEILQKIKEFCRKSLNKTPTNQQPAQLQAIYEKQPTATDLSPVSYVSVETHQRPGSRMYAAPQVPQRMHSLPAPAPGHFVPIAQEIVTDPNTNSPIYAHVVKRGSLQSNQSELYEIPHRTAMVATTAQPTQYIIRREPELKPVYIRPAGTLQRPESAFSPAPTQYILVDGEKLQPAQIITAYQPATELYAQPQYVRPHQLQSMPGAASYGYITVREPISIQPQIIRPRLHDGRSTPLILDRSSQQVSQIYWTPQHQRLQQQAGLLTDQISPRYALKQSSAVMMTSAAGPLQQQQQFQNRATTPIIMQQHQPSQLSPHLQNIPSQQQQQRHYSASPLIRESTPHKPQQPQIQELTNNSISNARQSPAFDWESGSEAGEVQRIMEKQQQHDQHKNGELKRATLLRNFRLRMANLLTGKTRK
ncbi:uncharacterized protein LOC101899381 isoform X1 [Musca domestica]|uniref:Uncharacterized protein LOC101899381 isoform X1 n=1 Tax=Musca domestica TaxID=7370 RepID=A0ABM3VC13_MUSDO|nr:uncharacterized protein LOC101899381 isoform X1 [Musca domestica]XP_058983322.1 uncharacterized protein LOC101899381 isoform X1 [Musca domestica]XP_058983323.1 uncharacterized protein LOC101899381 isoform X1 [Musca domestica]XP_058983324.1 uncharacterized protein LOC101899381 isoform X1 [Musca domestica]XP_058983325.1 uncharacterized protein LOC101899381 isoform X1 [Musca domestica]XP_058983326.1 uncharacterized protein LOC101899381 isoform X1 [Musca domestica]